MLRLHTVHCVFIWSFHAVSWIHWLLCALWPECVLVYACTLPPFSYLCIFLNDFGPRQHVFLHWVSIAETCKTWQQIASSTMRDSTEHDSLAHIVNLFCQKEKKKREKKSSSPPQVKWINFKDSWAVRKLWNCLCRSIAELYNGVKVKQRSLHS